MKTLMMAALAAFLAFAHEAAATTLGFSVEATSQTLGGVTDIIFHYDVTGDDPSVTFTATGAFVDFGGGFGSYSPPPPSASGQIVTSFIYPAAGVYTVTAVLTGFFSDDSTLQDFGNGTTVTITGFSDIPGTPIPPSLLLFATALLSMGFIGWRRKRLSL